MALVDLLVVYSPVGGGHKAAALAVAEAAEARGLSVALLDLFTVAPRVIGGAYVGAHLAGQNALPLFYGSAYEAANHAGGALEPMRHALDALVFGKLVELTSRYAPRAIVSTHHLPLAVFSEAMRTGLSLPPITAVVTDYTAHACWVEPSVTTFAVASEQARCELALHGVDLARVVVTGIPVRPRFEAIAPAVDPREGEALRVLVTSGGFGVGPLARIVRSFAPSPSRVALTVVCGKNEALKKHVERIAKRHALDVTALGYESDMPSRVADAHVVVGKAGGLTVSETLAAGRPMIVVGAVPGNEKRNEALVVAGGAGVACKPGRVGEVVARLAQAGALAAMGARGRLLVKPRAADRVVDVALTMGREPRVA